MISVGYMTYSIAQITLVGYMPYLTCVKSHQWVICLILVLEMTSVDNITYLSCSNHVIRLPYLSD